MSDPRDLLIVDELRRALDGVVAIYLFGSSAQASTHPSSDVDVAVLARNRLTPAERFDLQERLAALVGRDVDLLDLAGATPVMAIQVVTEGRLLHDGDTAARELFEDRTFGAYARLNEVVNVLGVPARRELPQTEGMAVVLDPAILLRRLAQATGGHHVEYEDRNRAPLLVDKLIASLRQPQPGPARLISHWSPSRDASSAASALGPPVE
jgi:uncharacterized protein